MNVAARLSHWQSLPVRLGERLTEICGWRRNLLLFLSGVCATLALPPFHLWPLLILAFPAFFYCAGTAWRPRRSFLDGWFFGIGFFVSGIYWFACALLVDAARFGWMIPFAVFGLSAIFACYSALAGLGFYAARALNRGVWPFFAAALWTVSEGVRSYFLTGFAWNQLGNVFSASDASLQAAAWLGVYGLSYVTVALCMLPVLYFSPHESRRQAERYGAMLWGGVILLGLIVGLGSWRLQTNPTRYVEGANFRLVQAGVQQYQKWADPNGRMKAIQSHEELTRGDGFDQAKFVVWSETSMTYPFLAHDEWANELSKMVPNNGLLFTGVVRIETAPAASAAPIRVYNSLQVVDKTGDVLDSYDKRKLVPFGEYVPFRGYLPVEKITHGNLDFSTGVSGRHIPLPGTSTSVFPLICYEATFPELSEGAWPSAILNITNDTWFGNSSGPYQHLAMSRMRAVEQGVGMMRDANSGVSAVVDAYGRIIKSLPLNAVGVIDSPLPKALDFPTFYSSYGVQVLLFAILATFIISFANLRCVNAKDSTAG